MRDGLDSLVSDLGGNFPLVDVFSVAVLVSECKSKLVSPLLGG